MQSPKTWLILLLAATTAGGAWLAWRQNDELAALRAAAMNRDERASMQKRVWDLEKSNREMQDRLAARRAPDGDPEGLLPPNKADRSPRDPGGRGPVRADPRRETDQQAKAMRDLVSRPDVQSMIAVQQKAAIDARYSALFKNLNLPAAQIDKLKGLLAERTTTMLDVLSVASDQGVDPRDNPAAFRQLVASTQDEINKSIKSLLGDQGFAQLANYEQTMPQRNLVNELQQRLSYSSTPLSNTQADQLVQILASNPPPRPVPGNPAGNAPPPNANPGGGPPVRGIDVGGMFAGFVGGALSPGGPDPGRGGGGSMVTPAAVAQSQTILAPPQVAALQQIQQQQQTQQQLRQLWSETVSGSQPPNSAGAAPANPAGTGRKGGGKQ